MTRQKKDHDDFSAFCNRLREQALVAQHRHMIVLSGSYDWCIGKIHSARILDNALWVTAKKIKGIRTLAADKATSRLGLEVESLVYDAFSGFDPTAFGALSGTIQAGGLLVLMTPDLPAWPGFADPINRRVTIHPFPDNDLPGRYLSRLSALISRSPLLSLYAQKGIRIARLHANENEASEPFGKRTADQHEAVEAIVRTIRGKINRPLLITGDRGRGKSAALGMAAARLMQDGVGSIWMTAPRQANSQVVFRHVVAELPLAVSKREMICYHDSELIFIAPDALLQIKDGPFLLIVDEAAAIPTSLLKRMLQRFPRIVFTSTIHGYEGNGRGFALRFQPYLDNNAPGWQLLELVQPIRWAQNDPVEALTNQILLLDSQAAEPTSAISIEACEVKEIDRDQLALDESLLRQIFGLLVEAHYQTTPMDLRHLLDGPNIRLWVAIAGGIVVATAMTATEGGFSDELSRQVFAGERRPSGHVLPQVLAAQGCDPLAASRQCLRIIRIAVHPRYRRQGLGRHMITTIQRQVSGCEYIGASFAMDSAVIEFWKNCGFRPIHLGLTRNSVSGAHAVIVARSLQEGHNFLQQARAFFVTQFYCQLRDCLNDLDRLTILALLEEEPCKMMLTDQDQWLIGAVAQGHRGYESSMDVIQRWIYQWVQDPRFQTIPDEKEQAVIIKRVLQGRSWREVVTATDCSGKKSAIKLLRSGLSRLLSAN